MRHVSTRASILLPLLLGCGAPASAALPATVPAQVGGVEAEPDFAPIRFGDPEGVAYDAPFFPGASHDAAVPTPDSILGALHGSRLIRPAEVLECFRAYAAASPRMELATYGRTHEGRELVVAICSTPENLERLDGIRADLARLADPRGLSDADAERIVSSSPAVAWMGYSIHGDETSGTDAAVALGHHLAACTDADVLDLLSDVVVLIDPSLNPDGRARIVSQVEQMAGLEASLDHASMQRGRWPWGRGNHYLFDMNRDWMVASQPETRGRIRVALEYHPQLFVDAHEMGPLDTFLFYPQAAPRNPHLPAPMDRWQKVFGDDQGLAFDRHGWAYYTREWADAWAPFYSDAWGSLNGAIGILYEQARTMGVAHERASGRVLTYREAVHHQLVSSLANLETLAANREAVLRDYVAGRRTNVSAEGDESGRMFVLVPGKNPDRERALLDTLLLQGIEVRRAGEGFTASAAVDRFGARRDELEVEAGAFVVAARQPQAPLVRTFLGFDVRIDEASLLEEREDLEREGESNIYDDTAWSLPLAYDVESWWCDAIDVGGEPLRAVPAAPAAGIVPAADGADAVAWAVDGSDDASVRFAARAMALGVAVHLADEPFRAAGREFPGGSLLVRRNENGEDVAEHVARAAGEAGVEVFAAPSGRSPDEGPDLGGGHFALLEPPRVALLGNAPVRPDAYGHVWHLLDRDVGLPVSFLDADLFGSYDLRRYNVIVLPPAWGSLRSVLEPAKESLEAWIRAGGTLVACGSAVNALTSEQLGLTSVVRRRDALEDLEEYAFAARREREALAVELDWDALWTEDGLSETGTEESNEGEDSPANGEEEDGESDVDPVAEREDAWRRRFAPRGVFLNALVDDRHWLGAGCGARMPAYVSGSTVLLARSPVQTPLRLGPAEGLRLSGLLWPEAREREAEAAHVTVERRGNGQVILFDTMPAYRASLRAEGRLLANAVVYGPGAGARAPVGRR